MKAKIASFLITLLINVAVGVVLFFFMMLAMNGFSESDALYGFGFYILLAVIVSLSMGAGAAWLVHVLTKRQFGAVVSSLIAIPVFSVVGAGLKIVCSIIGVLIAEYVRVNY